MGVTTSVLKPCPFCGGEAELNQEWKNDDCEVGCFNGACLVEPHAWAKTKDEALAIWNIRAKLEK